MYKIKVSGIYLIEHISGYYYVGKSNSVFERFESHITNLKMNKHHSPAFQELFNNTNIIDWNFKLIYYVSKTDLKKQTGLKGKEFDKYLNTFLLKKEKELMSTYSINYALNKMNKNFG
jgi:hypothetical protein